MAFACGETGQADGIEACSPREGNATTSSPPQKVPIPSHIHAGSLLRLIANGSAWSPAETFPAHQEWADEIEKVLAFLVAQDRFSRFLPRLKARTSERDAALSEAWTAFFFHRIGFTVTNWEPEAVTNRPGDLECRWRSDAPIFVEVKGPGWESELNQPELAAGRQKLPKYSGSEPRWIDPAGGISYAIEKALPKFATNRQNLLVVMDDFFVSPMEWVPMLKITDYRLRERLTREDCGVLGAVFLLRPFCYGPSIDYRTHFIENRTALPSCTIPVSIVQGLSASNRKIALD